jgi:hypothetical protein
MTMMFIVFIPSPNLSLFPLSICDAFSNKFLAKYSKCDYDDDVKGNRQQ